MMQNNPIINWGNNIMTSMDSSFKGKSSDYQRKNLDSFKLKDIKTRLLAYFKSLWNSVVDSLNFVCQILEVDKQTIVVKTVKLADFNQNNLLDLDS